MLAAVSRRQESQVGVPSASFGGRSLSAPCGSGNVVLALRCNDLAIRSETSVSMDFSSPRQGAIIVLGGIKGPVSVQPRCPLYCDIAIT